MSGNALPSPEFQRPGDNAPDMASPPIFRAPIPIGPDTDFLRPPTPLRSARRAASARVAPPVPARLPSLVDVNTSTLSAWLDNLPTMSWDFPDPSNS